MATPENNLIIKIQALSKTYEKGTIKIPALRDVTFDATGGQFVGIVGKSGSGKSTLLNLIGGLDRPTDGRIIFNDRDLSEMNRYELALHRRFSVGMIFQSFNLVPSLSAFDNVILPLIFSGMKRNKRLARGMKILEQVSLEHRSDHYPSELSGGEAQRVAIARALVNEPDVILADEPTGNLDSITSEEIINLLVDLNQKKGLTVLMVTHDQDTAGKISDKVIRLKDGMIIG
jgi:putative ABC transport system ATP-binding protein